MVVDYFDSTRTRRLRTFRLKRDAQEFLKRLSAYEYIPPSLRGGPLSLTQIQALPTPPLIGIYFLFRKGALQYIGQSTNAPVRVEQHRRGKGRTRDFDTWCFLPCAIEDLDTIEAAYIRLYQPPGNLGRRSNGKAEPDRRTIGT